MQRYQDPFLGEDTFSTVFNGIDNDFEFGTDFGDTQNMSQNSDHDISLRTVFPDQWEQLNTGTGWDSFGKVNTSSKKLTHGNQLKASDSGGYFDSDMDEMLDLHSYSYGDDKVSIGHKQPFRHDQQPSRTVSKPNQNPQKKVQTRSSMASRHESIVSKASNSKSIKNDLVHTSALNDPKLQNLFSFDHFNRVQSQCFQDLYHTDKNIIVSAPTGAGKTVLMELALLRTLKQNGKVVYMAPTKALCDEKARDWSKFQKIGAEVGLITGDNKYSSHIQNYKILVTTPEKWDSITRSGGTELSGVALLLVDEVHTLKDGARGATLEVVMTRMKQSTVRIVAVSATVPNLQDFATWCGDDSGPATMKVFGEEYRPVKLERHVVSFPDIQNEFVFDDQLKQKLPNVIESYSQGKATLVFCPTRKQTVTTAEHLVKTGEWFTSPDSASILSSESRAIQDKKLASLVAQGVGYHHAGLELKDRHIIESLFLKGVLQVICTTSTLAVGVNLPAQLVVIKGTSQWDFNAGKRKEYSDHDILQMMGRAGRPQFDTTGVAVIMTQASRSVHFENLIDGKELIESSLHESLIEHVNAEIVLGTTLNRDMALEWLSSTFLYHRIKKNPGYYRIRNCSKEEAKLNAENRLEAIFMRHIDLLVEAGFVNIQSDGSFATTEYGKIMAMKYLSFETAKLFVQLPLGATEQMILDALCKADCFNDIRFHNDKGQLNLINKNSEIRYPIKGKVATIEQKISLCLQAVIGGVALTNGQKAHSLGQDGALILHHALRVSRGMVALFIAKRDPISMINAIKLGRSIQAKLWSDSPNVLRQIEDITSFDDLMKTDGHKIETITNRNPPFGTKVLMFARNIPVLDVKVAQINTDQTAYMEWTIELELKNAGNSMTKFKGQQVTLYLVCGTTTGEFVDLRKYQIFRLTKESFVVRSKMIPSNERFSATLICPEIVGIDVAVEMKPMNTEKKSRYFGSKAAPIAKLELEVDAQDYFDDIDMADLIELESTALPVSNPQVPSITAEESIIPLQESASESDIKPGNIPCNHFCKDKQSHKTGISLKAARKRKRDSGQAIAVVPENQEKILKPTVPKMEAKPMEPEVAVVKKKATFVPLDHSSDSSPIVEKTVKDEFMNWKNETIGSKPTDSWKSSNALFKSRSNQSLGKLPLKSFSIDSFSSIDPEFAQLDYLHATGCPAPLPSEVIRVPSFHSQDLDLDEDMESILKQFL